MLYSTVVFVEGSLKKAFQTGVKGVNHISWNISYEGDRSEELSRYTDDVFRSSLSAPQYEIDDFVDNLREAMKESKTLPGIDDVSWSITYTGKTDVVDELAKKVHEMQLELGYNESSWSRV